VFEGKFFVFALIHERNLNFVIFHTETL
jgi:hypothetical protein